MKWFLKGLKQYSDFDGRARRKEYWMYTLFYIFFAFGIFLIDSDLNSGEVGMLYLTFIVLTFIPSFAVQVRRLHDIGKSGWWILIQIIPCIGGIVLFVFMTTEGDVGPNLYGPDPKNEDNQPNTPIAVVGE